jgi:hypothetical protein
MSCRVRKPETVKLEISRGDWLLVKKHLTAGERRKMFGLMVARGISDPSLDPSRVGLSKMITYMLDWSFTDADGKPLPMQDQPADVVEKSLDAIDGEDFTEVLKAIEAHDTAMEQERAEEKNDRDGANVSSATSPSVA